MARITKIGSIIKKGETILKDGLSPYKEGKKNFRSPLLCMEELAKKRLETCKKCEFFKKEPNTLFQVGGMYGLEREDSIQELTNMSCMECGCISSYKLRQNAIKCKKWLK